MRCVRWVLPLCAVCGVLGPPAFGQTSAPRPPGAERTLPAASSTSTPSPRAEAPAKAAAVASTAAEMSRELAFRYVGVGRTQHPPLVILSSAAEAGAVAATAQDMEVMSRIFDKTLAQQLGDDHVKIPTWYPSLLRMLPGVESIYLEGFGALFILGVKFPLAGEAPSKEVGGARSGDSVWDAARAELFGGETAAETRAYDATRVKKLQDTLLDTLKHAANIRNMKANESIAVAILGGEPTAAVSGLAPSMVVTPEATWVERSGETRFSLVYPGESGGASRTVLTVRVLKSDVDAFAQGNLTLDQFRTRAAIFAY